MSKLEPLRSGHAEAVLAFERDNRAYFATSISDRGDAFFDQFVARFQDSLAEQGAGDCAFFVRVGDNGEVIGHPAGRTTTTRQPADPLTGAATSTSAADTSAASQPGGSHNANYPSFRPAPP